MPTPSPRERPTIAPASGYQEADLGTYADAFVGPIGGHDGLVVVGQSFGAFTAPLVCDRIPAKLLVFVAGIILSPGERPDDWWSETGYDLEPRERDRDDIATYYHDVSPELASEAMRPGRDHRHPPRGQPWPLPAMPCGRDRWRTLRGPSHPIELANRLEQFFETTRS